MGRFDKAFDWFCTCSALSSSDYRCGMRMAEYLLNKFMVVNKGDNLESALSYQENSSSATGVAFFMWWTAADAKEA